MPNRACNSSYTLPPNSRSRAGPSPSRTGSGGDDRLRGKRWEPGFLNSAAQAQ